MNIGARQDERLDACKWKGEAKAVDQQTGSRKVDRETQAKEPKGTDKHSRRNVGKIVSQGNEQEDHSENPGAVDQEFSRATRHFGF